MSDAPGPFDRVKGWIDYRVANSSCEFVWPFHADGAPNGEPEGSPRRSVDVPDPPGA